MKATAEHGFLVDGNSQFTPATVTVRVERTQDFCTMSFSVDSAQQMLLIPVTDKIKKLLKEVI